MPLDKRGKKFHAELDQYLAAKRQQERVQQKAISEYRRGTGGFGSTGN